MLKLFYTIIGRLLSILSKDVQNQIFKCIIRFTPIFLLQTLPFSYGVYLRCLRPPKGGVVLDCGAHIGNCAILFSRLVGPDGLVICVEAFPDSYEKLVHRIKQSRLNNVVAINKGIWNRSMVQSIDAFTDTISCRLTTNPHNAKNAEEKIQIDCISIDEILSEYKLNRVDLIKMDIEGAEIEALQGASQTMATMKPVFAIASYHKREGRATYAEVEKILKKHHYDANTFFPPHLTTCGKPK
jgi:FkbM family methyltransferase